MGNTLNTQILNLFPQKIIELKEVNPAQNKTSKSTEQNVGNITNDHFKTNLFAVWTTLKESHARVHSTSEDWNLLTTLEKDKKR